MTRLHNEDASSLNVPDLPYLCHEITDSALSKQFATAHFDVPAATSVFVMKMRHPT
jgi:hypothetical protein